MEKSRTSIAELNKMLGGFMMGDLTVWTGKRGEGKSTLLSQVLLDAVDEGHRVCAYSGELRADRFQYWFDIQAAGPHDVRPYASAEDGRTTYFVPADTRSLIHDWYDGKMWIYDNAAALTDEEITVLNVFEQAAKRYDCKVFLIDNMMTVDFGKMPESDFYLRQTRFVNQLATFANLYNVHVHLVAHPRKTGKEKQGIVDNDDVGGSGNITNRAANVISVNRMARATMGVDVSIEVLKNRWEGVTGSIGLLYDNTCRRLYAQGSGNAKVYGWAKHGFIEVEQTVFGDVFGDVS